VNPGIVILTKEVVVETTESVDDYRTVVCVACRGEGTAPDDLYNSDIEDWFYEQGWWLINGIPSEHVHCDCCGTVLDQLARAWVCGGCMTFLLDVGRQRRMWVEAMR